MYVCVCLYVCKSSFGFYDAAQPAISQPVLRNTFHFASDLEHVMQINN